jgi:hypothetical protein
MHVPLRRTYSPGLGLSLGRLRNPAVYKILINLMILEKLRQNCHYEFCDVQQNLKVQATIHSQLSYFTLKKNGWKKKGYHLHELES